MREKFIDRRFGVINLFKIPEKRRSQMIWRYFVSPMLAKLKDSQLDEREYTADAYLFIISSPTQKILINSFIPKIDQFTWE